MFREMEERDLKTFENIGSNNLWRDCDHPDDEKQHRLQKVCNLTFQGS
jgi:Mg2+ and Co2+ transporter CorA